MTRKVFFQKFLYILLNIVNIIMYYYILTEFNNIEIYFKIKKWRVMRIGRCNKLYYKKIS